MVMVGFLVIGSGRLIYLLGTQLLVPTPYTLSALLSTQSYILIGYVLISLGKYCTCVLGRPSFHGA